MNDLVLKIEDLTKIYKLGKRDVQPLTDLNLEVKRGEFTAIMGPSGSGKQRYSTSSAALTKQPAAKYS